MGLFDFFKRRSRLDDGAMPVLSSYADELWGQAPGSPRLVKRDVNYLLLNDARARDLVSKFWDGNFYLTYHGNSDEFPDCDDFALVWHSGMVRGAIKSGFKYPPMLGRVVLQRRGADALHEMCWLGVRPGKLLLFEPQNGKYEDSLDGVARVVEVVL